MLIRLESDQIISYAIKKNPSSLPLCHRLSQGVALGWFHNERGNHYSIYYRTDQFLTDQASAMLEVFKLYLRDIIRPEAEELLGSHYLYISLVQSRGVEIIDRIKDYFPQFETATEMNQGYVQIKLSSKNRSIVDLAIYGYLLIGLLAAEEKDYYFDIQLIQKMIGLLNHLNAPYMARYLFKLKLLYARSDFEKLSALLGDDRIKFSYGDNYQTRVDWVRAKLKNNDDPLVDIGCGNGKFWSRLKSLHHYYGLDLNRDEIKIAKERSNNQPNVQFYTDYKSLWNDVKTLDKVTVLLIEVIEHMTMEEAKKLIQQIWKNELVLTMLISTPNRSFNQNYKLTDQFRHQEHCFELDRADLLKFIEELGLSGAAQIEHVGDEVGGEPSTWGIIVRRDQ